ncbi:MAG: response regulator [Sandaracinaceae bacterium]|nr:response regulator [Sandaracinaceae bacterium]
MTPLSKSRILVVDDNRDLAENYAEILELRGASVRIGASVGEARSLLSDDLDVGLVDVQLPDGLGYEVLRSVKERAPDAEVLLVTGQGSLDDAVRAVGAGVYAYVLKPVHPETLITDVERAVRQVRSTRELRAKEEALRLAQRTESVARLVQEVAHDFNNLLTVIAAYAENVALDADDPEEIRAHADGIVRATRRGAALTRQLLTYSRRRASRPVRLEPNRMIEDLAGFWQHVLGARIRMEVALDADLGSVLGDVGQLEQVLMNLVINARDAMPEGGTLRIASQRRVLSAPDARAHELAPGAFAALCVADTGAGMDEATRARATTTFFSTKGERGTGLGLSTAKSIVVEHGGALVIDSALGRGTRVEILLPELAAERDSRPPNLPAPHVLLVEDEELLRLAARAHLEGRGFVVSDHARVADALDAARSARRLDAVVSDLSLPDGHGDALVAAVRALHPEAVAVYMTGHDPEGSSRADAQVLSKPFDLEEIPRVLRKLLDGGEATRLPLLLLVEDEPVARAALTDLLADRYDVTAVGSAAEALAVVRRQHRGFDVLCSDISLPDMDGRELWAEVRELHPSTRAVFVTGRLDPELPAGAGYVQKPVDLDALERALAGE